MSNLVPLYLYNKTYIENTDTCVYKLRINKCGWNIDIKITYNFINVEASILSNGIEQYYKDLKGVSINIVLTYIEEFLKLNNMLLYIEGYAYPSYNKKVNFHCTTPSSNYNYDQQNNNYYQDR